MQNLNQQEQNLGRIFNTRIGRIHVTHLFGYEAKLPNLKLKARPKQLLGYLSLDILFPPPPTNWNFIHLVIDTYLNWGTTKGYLWVCAGNTKGGSITVQLTSCLTCLY